MIILSQQAQQCLARIKDKVKIKAIDFRGPQLDDLAVVYFEVTQYSTGKGRVLSKSCNHCIQPAVHIVYNFLQQNPEPILVEEPAKVTTVSVEESITVQVDDWNDLTKAELWSQIKKRGLSAPTTANKTKLIEILNGGK